MNKRSSYEVIVVAVIVVLALTLGTALYAGRSKIRKSNLLIQELSMLRSSITLFKMMNGKNPDTLEQLNTATYKADSTTRPYLDMLPDSKDGKIVDPFGSAYRYDPKSGWVYSATSDFERW